MHEEGNTHEGESPTTPGKLWSVSLNKTVKCKPHFPGGEMVGGAPKKEKHNFPDKRETKKIVASSRPKEGKREMQKKTEGASMRLPQKRGGYDNRLNKTTQHNHNHKKKRKKKNTWGDTIT